LGTVQGAKYIPKDKIDTWFVNDHIKSLKNAQ
jgi:hypothetical protein